MSNIDDVIRTAENEIGYLEKASNSDLNEKTKNAGDKNFTKYGLAQGCNGQPWCDAFVDWVFLHTFSRFEAERLLCGFSNYTPTSAQYFKQKGLFVRTEPQRGDIIFFKNSERINHTGIVTKVDNQKVYTIEGNTSAGSGIIPNGGGVFAKSYSKNNPRIAGYGRPNYSNTTTPTLYRGCIGVAVKEMQKLLNLKFRHNKIVEDGDFGIGTFNKLIEAEALLNLPKDGICTEKVWRALNGKD